MVCYGCRLFSALSVWLWDLVGFLDWSGFDELKIVPLGFGCAEGGFVVCCFVFAL